MNDDENSIESQLTEALLEAGASFADALAGDVYVEWYLSDLLDFCRDWRSEIEELG